MIIHNFYLIFFVANSNIFIEDSLSTGSKMSTQSTSSKKQKVQEQQSIKDFYEKKELSENKIQAINIVLVCAFVCCEILFNIIESLFFKELLYQL